MNTRPIIIAAGISLIILAAFYFYGEHKDREGYNRAVATLTQDSTVVEIDTVRVPYPDPFPVYIKVKVEAETDTTDNTIIYSTHIDTALVINKDTVAVINQDISFTDGIFETLMRIEIRPVEKIINVVKTEFRTVVKEVRISSFPNTFLTGFISAVITIIVVALALL